MFNPEVHCQRRQYHHLSGHNFQPGFHPQKEQGQWNSHIDFPKHSEVHKNNFIQQILFSEYVYMAEI